MMWEYRTEYREGRHFLNGKLAEYGSEGWEVCGVIQDGYEGFTLILKRPILEESESDLLLAAAPDLLAYALCEAAYQSFGRSQMSDVAFYAIFRQHGYTGPEAESRAIDWLEELRTKVILKAKGTR